MYNWALCRSLGGAFVLRIEDTDRARSTDESLQIILEGLAWLGIDWDEGPEFDAGDRTCGGGSFGPSQGLAGAINTPFQVRTADTDGDGDLDVLATSFGTAITMWKNLGGGQFGAPQAVLAGSEPPASWTQPAWMGTGTRTSS